jgi:hypothetical protein
MIRTRIKKDGENKDDKPKDQEKPNQPSGISKQRLENLWMP